MLYIYKVNYPYFLFYNCQDQGTRHFYMFCQKHILSEWQVVSESISYEFFSEFFSNSFFCHLVAPPDCTV